MQNGNGNSRILCALICSVCTVVSFGDAADAYVFEWVPVAASGAHTIDGNTIILQGGGQTVTLHFMISDWDPDQTGAILGSWQGTIDPAGYLGANASPPNPGVDLMPVGFPLTPDDGTFQATKVCTDDFIPPIFEEFDPLSNCQSNAQCNTGFVCVERPDYVYFGLDNVPTVTYTTLSYSWSAATPPPDCPGTDRTTKYYGGTLILEVPIAANGTYTIDLVHDTNFTLANNCAGELLGEATTIPVQIAISCSTNEDCDDNNECTVDVCEPNESCSNTPTYDPATYCCDPAVGSPDGLTLIDDGNECTNDVCDPADGFVTHSPRTGATCGGPPDAGDPCDAQNVCNSSGQCVETAAPAGTPCGNQVPTDPECDLPDICDGVGSCQPNNRPVGLSCGSDLDEICSDPDLCDGLGSCDPNDELDGTLCDDLNSCTQGETCTAGVCGGGDAVDCGDGLDCTSDECNEQTGECENVLIEGNCLIDGVCYADGGFNPANDCEECDPTADPNAWTLRPAGAQCSDGDPCTGTGNTIPPYDTCDGAGFCSGVEDLECNDTCAFAVEALIGSTPSNNDNKGPDDAEASCEPDTNNDVWFVFTGVCDGEVLVTTTGSVFTPSNDPVASVWDECPHLAGVEIACDDDSGLDLNAALNFVTAVGEDYFIRVAGFEDNTGDVLLNISMVNDCIIDDVCYLEGELNPDNDCQACIPALSTTEWSDLMEGFFCGDPTDTECNGPDACDGFGICEDNFKPAGVFCGDQSDTECDNPNTCDGLGGCVENYEVVGAPCGDAVPIEPQCDNPDICDGSGGCDPNFEPDGKPCNDSEVCTGDDMCADGSCVGTAIPLQPIVDQEGPKAISVIPQPIVPVPEVALRVTSPDWPCFVKYVGALHCDGDGKMCESDANCNRCTATSLPCLTDIDCDYGRCDNGQVCSIIAQNCVDASECARMEVCELSGDLCVPGPLDPIDINSDGLMDGLRGMLVDNPMTMTAEEWTSSGIMRCSKSALPCVDDTDCDRGICANDVFCTVSAQDCLDASTCVLDESCTPARIFLTGLEIVPSSQYDIEAVCGSYVSPPGSASTCLWADVNCNGVVNVLDVQLVQLGFQGIFRFATLEELDIQPCAPQGILNVSDIQRVELAIQGQTYEQAGCPVPCP